MTPPTPGISPPRVTYTIRNNAYSFGCTFAVVEVDIPMCKVTLQEIINVHDCGKLVNPALAEAQVHGGMSMAIGYGLSEQLLFDEKTGRPLNNNLLDYKLSTIMDHPHLEAQFVENAEPTSALRHQGLGRAPGLLRCARHPQRHLQCHRRGHRSGPHHPPRPLPALHGRGPDPGLRRKHRYV